MVEDKNEAWQSAMSVLEYQSLNVVNYETGPSRNFPKNIILDSWLPQYEIVKVGFCQLSLECFKDIYSLLKADLSLLDLTQEPTIIVYDDGSYAFNWWPHVIYRQRFDELFNHEKHALG